MNELQKKNLFGCLMNIKADLTKSDLDNLKNTSVQIDFIAPFPPPYGGMGVRFSRLVDILESRGFACKKIKIEWVSEGVKFKILHRFFSFLIPAWRILWSGSQIVHTVTGSIPNAYAIGMVLFAARLSGRKVILSIGGGDFMGFANEAGLIKNWMMTNILSLSNVIIPCNHEILEALEKIKITSGKMTLISNALPDEVGDRTNSQIAPGYIQFCMDHHPVILYVGGMQEHYGLRDALIALGMLAEKHPQIGLTIFVKEGGDQGFYNEVIQIIKTNHLLDRVCIYKSVDWLVAGMKYADVMIRTPNISDGDSRAIREALAVGLPVVASQIGYRPLGVALYPAGDIEMLAQAIDTVLNSTSPAIPYIDPQGDENIRKYENLYHQLISGKKYS